MSKLSKKSQYDIAKVLHWIVAFMAGLLMMSGWQIERLAPESKMWFLMIHSGVGTTVFLLMAFRWWWRNTNNLYQPSRWYKRPTILIQFVFYPLLLLQPFLGFLQAAYADYDVKAYGFLNYSAIATENKELFNLFHECHSWVAITLILVLTLHTFTIARKFFADDAATMNTES